MIPSHTNTQIYKKCYTSTQKNHKIMIKREKCYTSTQKNHKIMIKREIHSMDSSLYVACSKRDSNPHSCNSQRILSPSCLPFHHSSSLLVPAKITFFYLSCKSFYRLAPFPNNSECEPRRTKSISLVSSSIHIRRKSP